MKQVDYLFSSFELRDVTYRMSEEQKLRTLYLSDPR